jgi:hypothetical protein
MEWYDFLEKVIDHVSANDIRTALEELPTEDVVFFHQYILPIAHNQQIQATKRVRERYGTSPLISKKIVDLLCDGAPIKKFEPVSDMIVEDMPPIAPGNPFLSDHIQTGCTLGSNVVVMYEKFNHEHQEYIIVVNTRTGERKLIVFGPARLNFDPAKE